MWRLHCKRERRPRPGARRDRGRVDSPINSWWVLESTPRTPPACHAALWCDPQAMHSWAHALSIPGGSCRMDSLAPEHPLGRVETEGTQGEGTRTPLVGDRPTSSLLLAVESQVVFLGFLSGTHSPPRSKVITDWMELSGGRRRRRKSRWGREDAQSILTQHRVTLPSSPAPGPRSHPWGGRTPDLGRGMKTWPPTFGEDAGDVDAPQGGDVGEVSLPAGGGVEVPLQGLGVDDAAVIGGVDGAKPRVCKRDPGAAVRGGPLPRGHHRLASAPANPPGRLGKRRNP